MASSAPEHSVSKNLVEERRAERVRKGLVDNFVIPSACERAVGGCPLDGLIRVSAKCESVGVCC